MWATFRLLGELNRPRAQWRHQRLVWWLALAGGAAGLAAQTKLNGAISAFGVLAVLFMAAVRHPLSARRRAGYLFIGVVILAGSQAMVFLGSNPTLWTYPPREVVRVVRARTQTIRAQVMENRDDALQTIAARALVVPRRVLHDDALLPGTWAGVPLTLAGILVTMHQLRRWLIRLNENHAIVTLAVIGAAMSAPVFLTPLDWSRYYLLPVYFLGFSTVVGADWLVRRAWRFLSAARARR
jgi:hypothetical protein